MDLVATCSYLGGMEKRKPKKKYFLKADINAFSSGWLICEQTHNAIFASSVLESHCRRIDSPQQRIQQLNRICLDLDASFICWKKNVIYMLPMHAFVGIVASWQLTNVKKSRYFLNVDIYVYVDQWISVTVHLLLR